jgi:hypothetical protein
MITLYLVKNPDYNPEDKSMFKPHTYYISESADFVSDMLKKEAECYLITGVKKIQSAETVLILEEEDVVQKSTPNVQ